DAPLSRGMTISHSKSLIRLAHLAADAVEAGDRRLVILVDVHRSRIGAGGAFFVAEPLVSKPAAGPGRDVPRLNADRAVEIAGGILEAVYRDVAQAPRDVGLSLLHRQSDCGREIVDRVIVLAAALIEQAAIVVGLRVVWPDHDRFVEILQSLQRLFLLAIDDAAAEIRGIIIVVERQRLLVIGERRVELAGLPLD